MIPKYKMGICNKCQTRWIPVYPYEGRWLCKANLCFTEELEKNDGTVERNEKALDDYRKVVGGTNGIAPTAY